MPSRSSDITLYILAGLIVFCISGVSPVSAQTNISGIINQYSKVESVASSNSVTVANPALFSANDTVLLIQMAGVRIGSESDNPGQHKATIGKPGYYEFLRVSSVLGNTITFTQTLKNAYSVNGHLQLIKTPSYTSAVVTSQLTCMAWDSTNGRGGVLAFIVKQKLTLNSDISVSGKGFKGGAVSVGSGACAKDAGSLYFYDATSDLSGFKGEGVGNLIITPTTYIYPSYSKGRAPTLTGGGGGNGHFSGGGGGSNYGPGATGEIEVQPGCIPWVNGGLGGFSLKTTPVNGGVFMGGGGGASTYSGTATISSGGNGGGILIILSDTISGNGHNITADGASATANTIATAGAGGGGAAGSVIIQTRHFSSNPHLRAVGGNGGTTISSTGGEGGNGGGGLIWTHTTIADTTTAGGVGEFGLVRSDITLPLNGFLYNYIYSSDYPLSSIDSIAEGMIPPMITGTQPAGGNGSFTFEWQSSTTSGSIGFSAAPGVGTNQDYTAPVGLITTTWFRRVVTSGVLTDVSEPVQIIVHPLITGNQVGKDTTICYNQNPSSLVPLSTIGGGHPPYYGFKWIQSPDNISWTFAEGTYNTDSYDPAALTTTRYYRRIVNSGACIDTSSSIKVTVLNLIGNNTIAANQVVCQGTAFANLTGSAPTGGNNIYSYLWQSSSDGSTWSGAPGVNSLQGYNPSDDSPNTYFFQRIVMSGLHNCCVSTSSAVTLVSHPAISNNTIGVAQTICAGSSAALTGTLPAGGNGTYTYIWQRSPDNVSWADVTGALSQNFAGELLTVSAYYRRIVNSVPCTDISGSVLITVRPVIQNYDISLDASEHDTILTGTTPAIIKGNASISGGNGAGTYSYSWSYSTNNIDFTDLSISTINYQPGILTNTTWFRRTVTSGPCVVSSTIRITVLPIITNNNITGSQHICNVNMPSVLTGSNPSGGDATYKYLWEKCSLGTAVWTPAEGTNSYPSYSPPYLTGSTKFRRTVFSGENKCCTNTSNPLLVRVSLMPLNVTAGVDSTLHPYQLAVSLYGEFDRPGTGKWSVTSSDGNPVFDNDTLPDTPVRKLGFGENIFKWQVINDTVCVAEPDEVSIYVPKIVIPEAFSPNGDNLNDYFIIDGLENTRNELIIINTGGAIVYKTNDYRSNPLEYAWNGIDNNGDPLPEGTYYFLLTIKGSNDPDVPRFTANISGFIIIRR